MLVIVRNVVNEQTCEKDSALYHDVRVSNCSVWHLHRFSDWTCFSFVTCFWFDDFLLCLARGGRAERITCEGNVSLHRFALSHILKHISSNIQRNHIWFFCSPALVTWRTLSDVGVCLSARAVRPDGVLLSVILCFVCKNVFMNVFYIFLRYCPSSWCSHQHLWSHCTRSASALFVSFLCGPASADPKPTLLTEQKLLFFTLWSFSIQVSSRRWLEFLQLLTCFCFLGLKNRFFWHWCCFCFAFWSFWVSVLPHNALLEYIGFLCDEVFVGLQLSDYSHQ